MRPSDCLNFKSLVNDDAANPAAKPISRPSSCSIFSAPETLLRKPRDLYDAWVLSIITPLVEVARDDLKLFEYQHNRDANGQKRKLLKLPLMSSVPADQLPDVLDWSSSNLNTLYQIGYEARCAVLQSTCRRTGVEGLSHYRLSGAC